MSGHASDFNPYSANTSDPPRRSPNASLHVRRSTDTATSPNMHQSRPIGQSIRAVNGTGSWQSPPHVRQIPSISSTLVSPRSGRMSIGSLLSNNDATPRPQATVSSVPQKSAVPKTSAEGSDVANGRQNVPAQESGLGHHPTGGRPRSNSHHQFSQAPTHDDADPAFANHQYGYSRLSHRKIDPARDLDFATPSASTRPSSSFANSNLLNEQMLPPRDQDRSRNIVDHGSLEGGVDNSPRYVRHASVPAHAPTISGYHNSGIYSPPMDFHYGQDPVASGISTAPLWASGRSQGGNGYLRSNVNMMSGSQNFSGVSKNPPESQLSYPMEYDSVPASELAGRMNAPSEEYMHRRNDHHNGDGTVHMGGNTPAKPSKESVDRAYHDPQSQMSQFTGEQLAFGSTDPYKMQDKHDRYADAKQAKLARGPEQAGMGDNLKRRDRTHSVGERQSRDYAYGLPGVTVNGSKKKNQSQLNRTGGSHKTKQSSGLLSNMSTPARPQDMFAERPGKVNGTQPPLGYEVIQEGHQMYGPGMIALQPGHATSMAPHLPQSMEPFSPLDTAIPYGIQYDAGGSVKENSGAGSKRRIQISDLQRLPKYGKTRVDNTMIEEAMRELYQTSLRTGEESKAEKQSDSALKDLKRPEERLSNLIYTSSLRLPVFTTNDVGRTLYVEISGSLITTDPENVRMAKLWGSGVYTDDSDILAMLVHQGHVKLPTLDDIKNTKYSIKESRKCYKVVLRVVPRLVRYAGSEMNGIVSRDWGKDHDGQSLIIEQVQSLQDGMPLPNARKTLKSRVNAFLRERRAVFEGGCARDPYHRMILAER